MAVRTAYDPVNGTILTEGNLEKFPGGWIGYAEVTANQTGISSPTDLSGLSVTVTAGSSRRLHTQGFGIVTQNTGQGIVTMTIRNGSSTQLAAWQALLAANATSTGMPQRVDTPSSGSNTYKLSLSTNANTVDLQASASAPAFILVEDIGPSA